MNLNPKLSVGSLITNLSYPSTDQATASQTPAFSNANLLVMGSETYLMSGIW